MRKTLIIDFVLGFALQLFQGQDDDAAVSYVQKVIALKTSGSDVDAYLQTVADYLKGGERPDFDDLISRVDSEVDELLARDSGEEEASPDEESSEGGEPQDGGGGGGGSSPDPGSTFLR